jgi:ribose-phosphate pyrophosphokinase
MRSAALLPPIDVPMLPRQEQPIALFAGRSNPALASAISREFGQALGQVTIKNFSDGEVYVRYEESIRGMELFIIQSTPPPGDTWLELLFLIDAARRASAARITAVIPYFGYARQDRKDQPRVSIGSKLMADMLTSAGVDRILTMDLHAPQIQGFFNMPVDHLYGSAVIVEHIREQLPDTPVVVAPDVGSLKLARAYAKRLRADLALIDKRRPRQNVSEVMNIIGEVEGRHVLLMDDMVDTAGTLCSAASALKDQGALSVIAGVTHALLSGPAHERIEAAPIDRLFVTDTVALTRTNPKIEVVSVAGHFADAIRRIYTDESVSTLFVP